jgi:hypothetical protein
MKRRFREMNCGLPQRGAVLLGCGGIPDRRHRGRVGWGQYIPGELRRSKVALLSSLGIAEARVRGAVVWF